MSDAPLLIAEGVRRSFGHAAVLDGVSLSLAASTLTLLTGKNGSGKTTLVNCLTGFDSAYEGRVVFRGRPIENLSSDARARLGVVRTFQQPHLFTELRVADHLGLGRLARSAVLRSLFRPWDTDVPMEIVEELDLRPLMSRRGYALSFGEMKVLSTARALSTDARVLLLDEPLASLHGRRRQVVLEAIGRRRERGCAVLAIEHETQGLDQLADACYELLEGKLVERRRRA